MTPLTPAEKLVLEGYLADAEKAYHKIMIGGGVRVFVDQNQERIEYGSTNRLALVAYINGLRQQLVLCPMPGVVARPMEVFL